MSTPCMPTRPLPSAASPPGSLLRSSVCAVLHRLSQHLALWAVQLATCDVECDAASPAPLVEFHAEAGAPEGALYIDGVLVGHLPGVSRL